MKVWLNSFLRLAAGTYFLLTSLYCLLAFLPYTYCALIKAPPYPWMPWFVAHQAGLFWAAVAAMAAANWRLPDVWAKKDWRFILGIVFLISAGAYLSFRPFLPGLESNRAAYLWSLAALLPFAGVALWQTPHNRNENQAQSETKLFEYSGGLVVAVAVSVVYLAGSRLHRAAAAHAASSVSVDVQLALWSLVSHVALAMAVLSVLNLIFLIAAKTPKPPRVRRGLVGAVIVASLWMVLAHFLDNAMSFDGWGAQLYAGAVSVALTLWGFSLSQPFLAGARPGTAKEPSPERLSTTQLAATWAAIIVLTALALASRSLIGGEDWNGFVASTWALVFWVAMSVCIYRLRPARANYSLTAVLATLMISAFLYKSLQATEIFWARSLGSTDDEISLALEAYGGRDASFLLAHHVLGNARGQACGNLCRILREHTNIRDTHIRAGVRLVDPLTPAQGERPNIFIFIVDSMRPDYLGAYNPQVNYTPNLDALARDSVVFRNVYTQYAGTALSEPAIWAGSLLLHTHFPQPFSEVNSLQTMARVDGYQSVVSYDTVLQQLLPPTENVTKLDVDKKLWNQYEACSTVDQLTATLDARKDDSHPVMFYAQPMNVHQFARNDVPPPAQPWQSPAGMNSRITYEVHWVDSCLGRFVGYLKQHGQYDNSIIVVASDHGDATGEFGRTSHSTSIWPEIMHVPLIMHLPPKMRAGLVYDENRLSTLTDIVPSLYYLLGHRPIQQNPLYGRPLFAETKQELDGYKKGDLLLASDVRAVYGILTADARYLYVTYDSPAQSYLFDLSQDPNAQRDALTPALKQQYDEEIIGDLQGIADHYGYKPGVESLLASR